MRDTFSESLKSIISNKDRYTKMTAVLLVLSLLVSINVFFVMRQPGITMAGDAACGKQEHTHNEQCYSYELICPLSEDAHTHTDACYTERTLTCTIEDEAHVHTDDCYTVPELICTLDTQAHTHTETCYNKALTCTVEEHTHSTECYSDPTADTETQLDWQNMLSGYRNGTVAENIVRIARSQIGYKESERNFSVDENGVRHGYTRYGAWYGAEYSDWSAMFVSFCLNYAGADKAELPFNTGARSMAALWRDTGRFASTDYSPLAGDIVFFNNNTAGIILSVSDNSMEVVEGDIDNAVCAHNVSRTSSSILGYGIITVQEELDTTPAPEAESTPVPESTPAPEETAEPTPTPEEETGACTCGTENAETVDEHAEDCAYRAHIVFLATDMSADELFAMWQELNEAEQSFILEYTALNEALYDKAAALVAMLSNEGGIAELSAQAGDITVNASGSFNENMQLDIAALELSEEQVSELIAPAVCTRFAAWSIAINEITDGVASEIDYTGVMLTVASPETVANEGETLFVAYVDASGALAGTTQVISTDGAITFAPMGESTYVFYAQAESALDTDGVAEAAIGTNWIALRDSGYFTYWEKYASSSVSSYSADAQKGTALYSTALAVASDTSYTTSNNPSSSQIDSVGGSNTSDDGKVSVSKTIDGTDIENVFDITLTVNTTQNIGQVINEPDMAVVIVMDISNTMNSDFGGVTRYAAAMTAAEDFLDSFMENNTLGVSKVGYVAFNTDAHKIFDLSPCTSEAQANALKNTMRQQTGEIINKADYASAHNRFTNMEAGLKMAKDMLSTVSNKNKFVIFLSDGFPTTYVRSGYNGYDPIYNSISSDTHNYIKDDIYPNKAFPYGTNYSDRGAVKAKEMATSMKNSGITIFSIGVDVAGQKLTDYITQSATKDFSTMDRTSESYDIGGVETGHFENWLKDSIGSSYYYNSTNTEGLKSAYKQIFDEISQKVGEATEASWVATDPLKTIKDTVEFINFYNIKGTLVNTDLKGEYAEGEENTASFDKGSSTISWDLKNSGYTFSTNDGITTYTYSLKYRVRLKNESNMYVENKIQNTNDDTYLTYRVVQTVNGTTMVSGDKQIFFPIPSVHGYLAEFTFKKINAQTGAALEGAEFTLKHDTENCNKCHGDENYITLPDYTATSGADGMVKFEKLPSGHTYTLEETNFPAGFYPDLNTDTYSVMIAYDKITFTVMYKDGTTEEMNSDGGYVVKNVPTQYTLPTTGGVGIAPFVITGLLIISAAVIYGYTLRKRKRDGF